MSEELVRADVERAAAANDAKLQALAAQNVKIELAVIVAVRLGELVERLLGDMDQAARLEHEARCNARYAEMIAGIESQLTRARLLQGVQLNGNGRPA